MEKLTLEHLAAYLPFNLKLLQDTSRWFNPEGTRIVILKGLSEPVVEIDWFNINYEYGNTVGTFESFDFKPILHSLSKLTQEIEHNGEKFVPIYELFKLIDAEECKLLVENEEHYIVGEKDNCQYLIFDNVEFGDAGEYEIQFYFKNGSLVLDVPVWFDNVIYNNFKLYQKLFEWHFDVFGLIEKGLAIEKQ